MLRAAIRLSVREDGEGEFVSSRDPRLCQECPRCESLRTKRFRFRFSPSCLPLAFLRWRFHKYTGRWEVDKHGSLRFPLSLVHFDSTKFYSTHFPPRSLSAPRQENEDLRGAGKTSGDVVGVQRLGAQNLPGSGAVRRADQLLQRAHIPVAAGVKVGSSVHGKTRMLFSLFPLPSPLSRSFCSTLLTKHCAPLIRHLLLSGSLTTLEKQFPPLPPRTSPSTTVGAGVPSFHKFPPFPPRLLMPLGVFFPHLSSISSACSSPLLLCALHRHS